MASGRASSRLQTRQAAKEKVPAATATPMSAAKAAAAAPSRLGTADSFALLAGSTITNTGVSTIEGDIGLHPGSAVTGFESCTGPANCVVLTGAPHLGDAKAAQAKADLVTAYNSLVGLEATCTSVGVELGGTTLLPGVYCSPTFGLTGTVTLDGNNLVAPEFVFLTGSGGTTLITAVGSNVLLINGADACNVYWQVGSSATLGASSSFAGNILASASISFGTGASLDGSALALTGAVTLDNNTITDSGCGAAVTPPTDVVVPPSVGTPPTDVVVPPSVGTPPTDVVVPPSVGTPPTDVVVPPGVIPPTDVMIPPPADIPADGLGTTPQGGAPRLTTTGLTATGLTATGLTATDLTATDLTALTATGITSSATRRGPQSGPGLPLTGAPVQQELLLAGMAMALGSILVRLSKPAHRRSRTVSAE